MKWFSILRWRTLEHVLILICYIINPYSLQQQGLYFMAQKVPLVLYIIFTFRVMAVPKVAVLLWDMEQWNITNKIFTSLNFPVDFITSQTVQNQIKFHCWTLCLQLKKIKSVMWLLRSRFFFHFFWHLIILNFIKLRDWTVGKLFH